MKKAVPLFGLIVLLVLILSPLASVASAEPIIIDTEKGVPGFRTEPARDLPANWQYVHDHPDTSTDGWFDTNAYPPGQGNGSFWYTISFPDMGECKGIWETSVPYTGKYELFAWIPSPDSFDPYLDGSTPPSDYLPTKRAQYKVFHNDGVATVTIDQNVNMGRFTSLGVFEFDSTARVELSSNGVEFWRCVAFDAVKFVLVVHDMAVTDVSIIPPSTAVGQSTAICVTVTNEGSQQEENVSVKAFVDGAQVGSTRYVSLEQGARDTRTFLWVPGTAKNYSVEGVVGVVGGETDKGDNTKAIEVGVLAPRQAPIYDEIRDTTSEKTTISVTDSSPWFTKGTNSGSGPWYSHTYNGHDYISTYVGGMPGNPSQPDCWAKFKPYLSQSGKYKVYAYFYACKDTSTKVPFTVRYDGGSTTISVNQYSFSTAWKEKYLGTWNFVAGSSTYVMVTDATGEPYDGIKGLTIGTIKFVKINQPPTCSLSADPKSGNAPLTVTFTMSANDPDGSISSWVLDVDGDGNADYSGSGNPPSTQQHTYMTSGSYSVMLVVSDDDGETDFDTETVIVGENDPPTCSLSANPISGKAPLTVTFTMSASDPDGSITAWVLRPGDGSPDYSGSGSPPSTQTHTYQNEGNYNAILMVSDNEDATDSDAETINVGPPNQKPTCSLSADPKSGNAPLTVTFTMSANDPDGSISSWVLDVDGDGNADYSGSGNPPSTQQHTYMTSGSYSVMLVVSDNDGETDFDTETVIVGENDPPTCSLSANPISGKAPLTVTFTMSASDPDGSITAWVLRPGDGSPDYSGSGSPPSTQTHTYQNEGNYNAILMVSDNEDATDSDAETINVGPPNQKPTCTLSADPKSGNAPLTVTFTMSANDPDGSISSWVLDVDGDGNADYSGSGNPPSTQQHIYQNPGDYTAKLTVIDNDSTEGYCEETITVSEAPSQPLLCTTPDPPSHNFGSVIEGETRSWNFDITNCGEGTLTWEVSDNRAWIALNPLSGSTTIGIDTVTVTIHTAGLRDGIHTGYITVNSNDGSKTGTIMLNIQPPQPLTANAGGPYYSNINEPIQFHGSATGGTSPYTYAWDFDTDGETDSTLQNPTHSWSSAGTYYPALKVQDESSAWSEPNECTVHVFEPFTFVQVTDVHIGWDQKSGIHYKKDMKQSVERFTEIIETINDMSPKPKFVVVTGDLVEWNKDDFFYKFVDTFHGGLDIPQIGFYLIPGNHDRRKWDIFQTDHLENYHDIIKVYHGPIDSWLIKPDNYTFEYGGYLFICLDSGADCLWSCWGGGDTFFDSSPEGTGLTSEQWNELSSLNSAKPKIIFIHHPVINRYSDFAAGDIINPVIDDAPGGNDACISQNRKNFIEYCNDESKNVQLVLTGHTHKDIIFNAKGVQVPIDWDERPLFIQTRSATKDEYGFRRITVDASGAYPYPSEPILKFKKKFVWVSGIGNMVLHAYDSEGRHTGVDENGNIVREIPETYYIGNYEGNLEGIIFYNTEEDYKLTVTLKDGSIVPKTKKLQQPENQSFNLTITNQTADSLTTISYNNITFTENTTATVNLNRTAANYTMAIDYTGDNITDETKDPDSIETDYTPTATINTPVNNSIYRYGDQIVFKGTGIDIEDGILTNSSLVWSSNRDGFIGFGCECNTTNLTAGTHIIELTVNDSSGQTDTDNVTLTVIAPDLAVTNIAFSNPQPIEGEAVTINATIGNLGTANAADVTVQFFDGTPTNGTQIGTDQTIATLNIGENKTVSVVWDTTGEAGDNSIWVVADPADTIKEQDEENNQASKSIFVGAPNVLHIVQAQTDRAAYIGNEAVLISCIVQNASGNISANVSAEIEKPDSGMDNIAMAEGIVGYYYGTFTNTSLSGRYNVTIYANRTGFVGNTESLYFEVLDTTPPASVTNITNTSGPAWINWTWDNPLDPDFDHTLIYLNGSWKTATAGNCYFASGLNATTVYEIATRTVDADGNINATWVNQTAATISPCFIATAAYGTALHGDIDVLRDFRDEYLMPNPAGRAFVKFYYNTSPPLAEVIRDNEGLRTAVREGLVKPLVHITGMFV